MKINTLLTALLLLLLTTACTEEKLAFEVKAAPVLGIIEAAPAEADMVAFSGTFYELNKDGILDQAIGIDSIPVTGLEIKVFSQDSDLLETLTTDATGTTLFEAPAADLTGVSRLEWTGTYNGTNFRILKNL
ncbi:MAG: hypothetical protein AAGF89_00975 [Bacteroidota bacterium]